MGFGTFFLGPTVRPQISAKTALKPSISSRFSPFRSLARLLSLDLDFFQKKGGLIEARVPKRKKGGGGGSSGTELFEKISRIWLARFACAPSVPDPFPLEPSTERYMFAREACVSQIFSQFM